MPVPDRPRAGGPGRRRRRRARRRLLHGDAGVGGVHGRFPRAGGAVRGRDRVSRGRTRGRSRRPADDGLPARPGRHRPPAAEAGADGGEGGDDSGARRRRGDDGALPGRLTDCAAPRARPRGPGTPRARLRALGRQRDPGRDRRRGAAAGDQAGPDRGDRRGPPSQRRCRRRGRGRARARRQPVRPAPGGGVCRLRRRAARWACRGVELGRGDRGRAGPGQATGRRAARHRPRDARGLRRFEVALVHRPLARRRAAGGVRRARTPGFRRRRSPSCAGRRWSKTSAAPGCRTRSGTSPVR